MQKLSSRDEILGLVGRLPRFLERVSGSASGLCCGALQGTCKGLTQIPSLCTDALPVVISACAVESEAIGQKNARLQGLRSQEYHLRGVRAGRPSK